MRKTKSLVEELTVSDMKEVKLQRNLGRFRISWVAPVLDQEHHTKEG